MDAVMLITLGIWTVVVLIAVFVVISFKKQKNNHEQKKINYQAFFVLAPSFLSLGLIFTILSVTSDFPKGIGFPFLAMGIIYLAIGLANRNKKKKT